MRQNYTLSVVVPCYNEQEVLPLTVPLLVEHFLKLVDDPKLQLGSFKIMLVDDGSRDSTWQLIETLGGRHAEVEGIKLSRNFGHQAAMMAGLTLCTSDAVITLDADLQDDLTATTAMLQAFENGAELALGVRSDRLSDGAIKRNVAGTYYRILALLGAAIVHNHADFRLMSRKALDALLEHREVNLFLRGLVPSLGFSVTLVPYVRQPRLAGEVQYTVRKLARLAVDGITSFSVAPLRLIAGLGAMIFVATIVMGVLLLWLRLSYPDEIVPGWASTMLPVLFLGGIQLLSIGVLGEYIGKIYLEVKNRPRFIIEEQTGEAGRISPPG